MVNLEASQHTEPMRFKTHIQILAATAAVLVALAALAGLVVVLEHYPKGGQLLVTLVSAAVPIFVALKSRADQAKSD